MKEGTICNLVKKCRLFLQMLKKARIIRLIIQFTKRTCNTPCEGQKYLLGHYFRFYVY